MGAQECAERCLDSADIEVLGDKDQARMARTRRPHRQVSRGVDQVMNAMERDRRRPIPDIQQGLDPEDAIAVGVEKKAEPDRERRPFDRLVERERDRAHIGGVFGRRLRCGA